MGMFSAIAAERTEKVIKAEYVKARRRYANDPKALAALRDFYDALLNSGICDE
jgi:hypothetical protein